MTLEEQIQEALKGVNYPGYSRDIVSFGLVKGVAAANGSAGIDLELTTHNPEVAAQLKTECEAAVKAVKLAAESSVETGAIFDFFGAAALAAAAHAEARCRGHRVPPSC